MTFVNYFQMNMQRMYKIYLRIWNIIVIFLENIEIFIENTQERDHIARDRS